MRSAMLLSGLTTRVSAVTASCRVAMAGSSASIPGASRPRVSARSVSCSSGPSFDVSLSSQASLGEQPVGQPVLGQHPFDHPVLCEQPIGQPAGLQRALQAAALRGQAVEQTAGRCHQVDQPARAQQPVQRPLRRDRASQRGIVVQQPGQPVGARERIVDPQHVGHCVRAAAGITQRLLRQAKARACEVQARLGGGKPDPRRSGRNSHDAFAEIHSASVFTPRSKNPASVQADAAITGRLLSDCWQRALSNYTMIVKEASKEVRGN